MAQAAGSSVGKVTRYAASGVSTEGREGCWATVNDQEVYVCSWPACCQNTARITIACLAVGVLAWSATTLTFSSLEDNEFAGTSTGGPTPELRAAYAGTSAVLKFLLATASLAIVTEVAAIAVQIAARCLELKEFQPLSLAFHIPDIVVGGLLALMYVAGGVASAYYASVWGGRPEGCESLHDLEIPDPCSSIILTADCSILTVLSFVSAIAVMSQAVWAIVAVAKKFNNY